MDIKCFAPGCTNLPSLFCYCTLEGSPLCHLHILDHAQKNLKHAHNYMSIQKIIIPDMKEKIMLFLNSKVKELNAECEKMSFLAVKILSNVRMIIKKFYESNHLLMKICNHLLAEINQNSLNEMSFRKSKEELDQVLIEDYNQELKKRFMNNNANNRRILDEVKDNLDESCREFKSYLRKSFCMALNVNDKVNNPYIFAFQNDTKRLIKFNTENCVKTSEIIGINASSECSVMCCLPNNKLFVLFSSKYYSSTSYLIYYLKL